MIETELSLLHCFNEFRNLFWTLIRMGFNVAHLLFLCKRVEIFFADFVSCANDPSKIRFRYDAAYFRYYFITDKRNLLFYNNILHCNYKKNNRKTWFNALIL